MYTDRQKNVFVENREDYQGLTNPFSPLTLERRDCRSETRREFFSTSFLDYSRRLFLPTVSLGLVGGRTTRHGGVCFSITKPNHTSLLSSRVSVSTPTSGKVKGPLRKV